MTFRLCMQLAAIFVNVHGNDIVPECKKDEGWDIFLEACQHIIKDDSWRLLVIGSGAQDKLFDAAVMKSGLQEIIVHFSFLRQKDLRNAYNCMDIFVFSTYRKSESLGLVGLEAMACGTLSVLPDKYGPTSYASHSYNCIQFMSGNVDELSMAISTAMNLNDEEIKKIQKNAIKTALQYEKKENEKILLSVFDRIKRR